MQVDIPTSVGYALKRATTALHTAMDAELRPQGLSVSQYSCLELLARDPATSNAELARGAFVTRQAMHQLLGGLRTTGLVEGDGRGRSERFHLTSLGRARLRDASAAVAAVEQRMLGEIPPGHHRRLHADLIACVEALTPVRPAPRPVDGPSDGG